MTLDDYILFFRNEVRKAIKADVAEDVIAILDSPVPRRIFETLETLRVQGAIKDADFERTLTNFYWQFC